MPVQMTFDLYIRKCTMPDLGVLRTKINDIRSLKRRSTSSSNSNALQVGASASQTTKGTQNIATTHKHATKNSLHVCHELPKFEPSQAEAIIHSAINKIKIIVTNNYTMSKLEPTAKNVKPSKNWNCDPRS